MSDRVGYMAGNTNGRDHPQWPTVLRSELPVVAPLIDPSLYDEIWPVDVTLAQIMALSWRVRKWKFSGSCTAGLAYSFLLGIPPNDVHITTISGTATIAEINLVTFNADSVPAVAERDLVSLVFTDPYRALVNNAIGPLAGLLPISNWVISGTTVSFSGPPIPFSESGSTPASGVGALSGLGMLGGFVLFDSDSKLFAPRFGGIGRVINEPEAATPGFFLDVTFLRNPVIVSGGIGPIILKAPGTLTVKPLIAPDFATPLQLAWRLPTEIPGSTLSGGSGSAAFILEAAEFWPYKNSQGNPVYDSASGAQLVDPFS